MNAQIIEHFPTVENESSSPALEEFYAHTGLIKEVMSSIMKPGIHYGQIPGNNKKPTLLKPGAEVILHLLKVSVKPYITDLSNHDEIRYQVIVKGYYPTKEYAGGGVGECSSNEERYKWRDALCDQEYDLSPEDQRRIKIHRDKSNVTQLSNIKQVRVDPSDQANTVLKIAKKRALIDMCLTVAAISDVFTQDMEDLTLPEAVPAPETTFSELPLPEELPPPVVSHKQPDVNSTGIVDQIKRLTSKELSNGSTKWSILTFKNGWFSIFNKEHARVANFAHSENFHVKIFYTTKGTFKNISSIELADKL